ncbi:permease [Leptolyngbya sp. 'hensonii']|uniref:sulfite exporter TauE/SafE family protein n=1 Tax=Leptolyngbya sp. 'hensonii' TaxID=1922337 RepID=UPI00094FE217|nr:sulfite exporter TauE/SafE family protein [Leptolyngbya sp. 'hensonii']OLP15735.1 permease [Leptolyngbya sp. 'hensonii']
MILTKGLLLLAGGLIAGILAGFLGIGGGTILVPLLVALGYTPVKSVATSGLAILITSTSGTVQNYRMGLIHPRRVLSLGLPALLTAQGGVWLANLTKGKPYVLLAAFGLLLWLNIYLIELKNQLTLARGEGEERIVDGAGNPIEPIAGGTVPRIHPTIARLGTGGAAGLLAGLFGVGGGVIMVPLQMLLLGEPIKVAIQTSLGVIIITAISACIGHTLSGNILPVEGLLLGVGGLLGAQISTRLLPRLPDEIISLAFRLFLGILSIYIFWQAWENYRGSP